jgi:hypothetical protein
MASKKGKVHPVFQKRIDGLREAAQKKAQAFQGGQRDWDIPKELEDKSLTDIPALHKPAFEREEINANYEECLASSKASGTSGDLSGLKTQIDFMAGEEQAFRMRHSSIVRAFVHGHARLWGHGEAQSVFDDVSRQASDFIASGGAAQ